MLLENTTFYSLDKLINGHILVNEETGLIDRLSVSKTYGIRHEHPKINLAGKLVIPSLVDIHTHLRDFEESYKETYQSGANSAAAGGFTTVFDMPNKAKPVNSLKRINKILKKTQLINNVTIIPYFLLSKNSERQLISNYSYAKAYLGQTTGDYLTDILDILEFLSHSSGILSVHCEDKNRIAENKQKYPDTLSNHCLIRDPQTEITSIADLFRQIEGKKSNAKIHIAHVTLMESLKMITKMHRSFEVTPHHLFLTTNDIPKLGVKGKMNPPLRSKSQQEALFQAFLKGDIPIIATDHAPHTLEEKENLELSGVPGLETCLPLLLNYCRPLNINRLKLIIDALAIKPRRLMRLSEKGFIAENEPANMTIIDLKKTKTVRGEELKTKCKWSPWEGVELQGWPVLTMCHGKITYNEL